MLHALSFAQADADPDLRDALATIKSKEELMLFTDVRHLVRGTLPDDLGRRF
jgi:hypothetical protein